MPGPLAGPRWIRYSDPYLTVWERVIFGRLHVFTRHMFYGKSVILFVCRENVAAGGYDLNFRTFRLNRWAARDEPPSCPFDHEDLLEGWGEGTPCRCQPHHAGQAPGCPEGCPTHNHGGEDVPEGAIGGRATDEELADGDRCPRCPCAVGPECEACARECAR